MYFRNFTIVFALMTFVFVSTSKAQMWGYGMYGGMQPCGYPTLAGDGATSAIDELKEIANQIKDAQDELREKKRKKRDAEREARNHKLKMERNLSSEGVEIVTTHVENDYSCNSYKGIGDVSSSSGTVTGTVDGKEVKQNDRANIDPSSAVKPDVFKEICPKDKSNIVGAKLCSVRDLFISGKDKIDKTECTNATNEYPKAIKNVKVLDKEIKTLEDYIKTLKDQAKSTKKAAIEDLKDAARDRTEGGICVECLMTNSGYFPEKRETDWGGVAANVFTGLAGLYMGYKTNQMVADYNSSAGFATQPNIAAMSMGFPFLANGIYGALGGGVGSGAFGCGGTIGGGGNWNGPYGMLGPFGMGGLYNPMASMWGNPLAMMMGGAGALGGGMFMPGMGPWGMNGPWGLNPYGMGMFPGMGGMITGSFGFPASGAYPWMNPAMMGMMGMPGMGMPGMGMPGMSPFGFPGYGYMANGSFGMPMMGMPGMYPGMGMPMMGMPGMYPGMGMPMMGMPGMYPGMGMPMTGMPMMGMPGMYPGMMNPMMGMPGMYPGMMNPMMGMPGMGMPGMGMPGMGMDSLGSFQMQQQMMQMQMQQYQMQMQQQSRYYENYMQRQRAMMSLQQELMGLMNRIQMVQAGSSFGGGAGVIGGGYLGIGGGFGGGIVSPPGMLPGAPGAIPPPLNSHR